MDWYSKSIHNTSASTRCSLQLLMLSLWKRGRDEGLELTGLLEIGVTYMVCDRSVVRQEVGLAQIDILSDNLIPRLHSLRINVARVSNEMN